MVLVRQPPPNGLNYPLLPAPSEPPTLANIFAGIALADRLTSSYHLAVVGPRASAEDVAQSVVYLHDLCHHHSNADRPPTLAEIREVVREELQPIRTSLAEIKVLGIRAFNAGRGDGHDRPYLIIRFVGADGVEESPEDYDLPPLANVHIINTLNDEQLNVYLDRYNVPRGGLGADRNREIKIRKLKDHLGCSVA